VNDDTFQLSHKSLLQVLGVNPTKYNIQQQKKKEHGTFLSIAFGTSIIVVIKKLALHMSMCFIFSEILVDYQFK
jgi:accessory gene regulator protein AgrB